MTQITVGNCMMTQDMCENYGDLHTKNSEMFFYGADDIIEI